MEKQTFPITCPTRGWQKVAGSLELQGLSAVHFNTLSRKWIWHVMLYCASVGIIKGELYLIVA